MSSIVEPDVSKSKKKIQDLWEVVKNFASPECKINLQLKGEVVKPFDETKRMLREFAPAIDTWGLDLNIERRRPKYWGGLLARVVRRKKDEENEDDIENKDDVENKRCLQYLYVWFRQSSSVSLHWLVMVPLLMTIIGLLILYTWTPDLSLFLQRREPGPFTEEIVNFFLLSPTLAYQILLFETFIAGFGPYLPFWKKEDPYKPNVEVRPAFITTAIYWPLSWLLGINPIRWLQYSIGAMVFFAALWAIATHRRWLTAHDMDYLPVFVWIEKEGSIWKPKAICWDYWHYFSYKKRLEDSDYNFDEKRFEFKLRMDNPWHSLHDIDKDEQSMRRIRILFLVFACIFTSIALSILGRVLNQPVPITYATRLTVIWVIGISFYYGESHFAFTAPLIRMKNRQNEDTKDFEENLGFLSHEWLVVLWNLIDSTVEKRAALWSQEEIEKRREPRLVAITKMQEPFNETDEFWTTFRDDEEHLYTLIK
ncbi:MAG: hypothetical protein ACFFE2_17020 [Candidatus Thorarchaeota archaeon]